LLHGKGVALLLEAVAELRARGLDVRATIVGDGPARAELEATARRLDLLTPVRFTGPVGQDGLREIYARADVFCLPSFAEGIPVVAMEAMAMELPVVTTRIAGIPELVEDGTHGLLVPPGRLDLLTAALDRLVRAPEERYRMGRAGRGQVQEVYDVRHSARRMRAVLETELSLHFEHRT
jgi:glycosyltransferase involved in cell wall biosynthesis